jgi:ATP-binding protein involved in chromosome partitioning
MVASALKQFVTDVIWGELDYLIVDLPPGTGDIHLSLIQNLPVTGAIIVSTPQEVAIADAKKAISMFQMDSIALPIIGIVENMAFFTPPDMPEKKYFIFGEGGAKKMSEAYKIPFLGYLPLISNIRKDGDNGTPSVLNENSIESVSFEELVNNVARNIAILNQSKIKSHEEFINT